MSTQLKREYVPYNTRGWIQQGGPGQQTQPPVLVADNYGLDVGMMAKAILIGDAGVGKTSLLNRVQSNTFQDRWNATIGADLCIKYLRSSPQAQGQGQDEAPDIKLQLWDYAGGERFRVFTMSYARNASAALFCFEYPAAVTDPNSSHSSSSTTPCWLPPPSTAIPDVVEAIFDTSLRKWMDSLHRVPADFPFLPIVVGLKSDLVLADERREVAKEDESMATGPSAAASSAVLNGVPLDSFPKMSPFRYAKLSYLAEFNMCMAAKVQRYIDEALSLSLPFPVQCFAISSKTGEGVEPLLQYIANSLAAHRVTISNRGRREGAVRLPAAGREIENLDDIGKRKPVSFYGWCAVS